MKKYYFFYLAIISLVSTSCHKTPIELPQQLTTLPTNHTLRDIYFENADTAYISAGLLYVSGQIWKSTNGGNTWTLQRDSLWDTYGFVRRNQQSIVVSNSGFVYYNSNNVNWLDYQMLYWYPWKQGVFWADGSGVLVSGRNFGEGYVLQINSDLSADSLHFFTHELTDICATNDSTAYATGYGIILKSTNKGLNWTPADVRGDFYKAIYFPSEQVGYAVGDYGSILKTTDAGTNWTKLKHGNTLNNKKNRLTDVFFTSEQNGYVVGELGLFKRTTDGGDTWEELKSPSVNWQQIRIYNNKAYLMGTEGQLLVVDL